MKKKKKKSALKEYEFKRKYPVTLSVFKKHIIFTPVEISIEAMKL